jgi:hypothetical protein
VKPRYEPQWVGRVPHDSGEEVFLGHVGPLDVYYEDHDEDHDEDWIIVVGPEERMIRPRSAGFNFDIYFVEDRSRLVPSPNSPPDIHVELAEMCEIYALAARLGYIGAADG